MASESSLLPVSFVADVNQLHHDTVARWHTVDIENNYEGIFGTICQQHQFNYRLWHEEDIARSPDVGDTRIAEVKRAIDGFNQQRNDWIERVDENLISILGELEVEPDDDARLNTETPGSAIDRLSIMSLRVYHLTEHLDRVDVDEDHLNTVRQKLTRCRAQQRDLSQSLVELLDDLLQGKKTLRVYRQMKMYNDPTMNPYLYKNQANAA